RAGGTRVVLPAPVGARSTTHGWRRSASSSSGRMGSIGRGVGFTFVGKYALPAPSASAGSRLVVCRDPALALGAGKGNKRRVYSAVAAACRPRFGVSFFSGLAGGSTASPLLTGGPPL